MPSFVESTIAKIDAQLRALNGEIGRLESARAALTNGSTPTRSAPATRRRPRRRSAAATTRRRAATASPAAPAGRTPRAPAKRSPGRPRGRRAGVNRGEQALALIQGKPGITIPQLAKSMKIAPNYLYRVLPKLAGEGKVRREADGWHPTA
jgi:hypothetical protein